MSEGQILARAPKKREPLICRSCPFPLGNEAGVSLAWRSNQEHAACAARRRNAERRKERG